MSGATKMGGDGDGAGRRRTGLELWQTNGGGDMAKQDVGESFEFSTNRVV